MAYKTADHNDMSLFGNRLWKLMEEQHIYTSKGLAEKLYDNGLITVNQKDKEYGLPDDLRKRAIHAINRTIQEHINSKDTDKLQGQYINAYCVYFKCSADYLLGYIPYQTHKTTDIVKETGLSFEATDTLIRWKRIGDMPGKPYLWARNSIRAISDLLEQGEWLSNDVLLPIADYCCHRYKYENSKSSQSLKEFRLALFTATNGFADCIKSIYEKNKNN